MKITEKIASREPCAEAGWFAFDYMLDGKADSAFILSLRPLGSFLYLKALKRPFYKIESDHFLLRGVEGDNFFRLAVHRDYPEIFAQVETFIGIKEPFPDRPM